MIEDEKTTTDTESLLAPAPIPVNGNGPHARPSIDQRILLIARALGRQIAREQVDRPEAANDNQAREE